MAPVVFAPVTFNLAETTRMIEVARAIADRHQPVFMGYESDFVPLIEAAGFDYHACEPAFTASQRRQALDFDQGRSVRHPFSVELVRARVQAERRLIRETGAAAVVIGTNVTSMISARAERVPLFYPVPLALTRVHVEQTARLGLVSHQIVGGIADRIASSVFRWAYARVPLAPKAFREVARENGVRPLETVVSLIEADHNLLTVMPWELEGYDLPDSYQRVGPIFARLGGEVPEMVHELAAADRPLVYLALGSSGNRKLALRAARALGELPVNVVAPLRQYLRPSDALPANVHVTDLLPADQLGGLVDAAVLHGGQGTVQTACATGVPFVGMGLSPEQAWNVEVSVAQGNAVGLRPGQVGSSLFRSAVRDVLMDSGVRAAADRVRRAYADEDGAAAAARAINEVLASSRGA